MLCPVQVSHDMLRKLARSMYVTTKSSATGIRHVQVTIDFTNGQCCTDAAFLVRQSKITLSLPHVVIETSIRSKIA